MNIIKQDLKRYPELSAIPLPVLDQFFLPPDVVHQHGAHRASRHTLPGHDYEIPEDYFYAIDTQDPSVLLSEDAVSKNGFIKSWVCLLAHPFVTQAQLTLFLNRKDVTASAKDSLYEIAAAFGKISLLPAPELSNALTYRLFKMALLTGQSGLAKTYFSNLGRNFLQCCQADPRRRPFL